MKYSIVVQFQLEGLHNWPAAQEVFPEVGFLSAIHRHMFHFKCYAHVTHTDRDEEFIMVSRAIQKSLRTNFSSDRVLYFGSMSCEAIGEWLLEQFPNLYKVEVFEDGENGAIIER